MSEYQEQQARLDAQEAEFAAKLLTVEIDGWTAADGKYRGVDFIHGETGARFSVSTNLRWAKNGKVEASADWPKGQDGDTMSLRDWMIIPYGEVDPHRIGFSHKKTAKQIASDLTRRLIPGLVEKQELINAKIAKQTAGRASIKAVAEKIAAVTSYQYARGERIQNLSSCSAQVPFDGGLAKISSYRGDANEAATVDLKLSDLTVSQTLAILALLDK